MIADLGLSHHTLLRMVAHAVRTVAVYIGWENGSAAPQKYFSYR
jgi:hypothetical protein